MDDVFTGFLARSSSEDKYDDETSSSVFDNNVLEYARHHKLTTNYTIQPSLAIESLPSPSACSPGKPSEQDDLDSLDVLARVNINEKLMVDAGTRVFLSAVLSRPHKGEHLDETPATRPRIATLKLEEPIIHTDPELDLRAFGSFYSPDLRQVKLSIEIADIEKDEGLEWPQAILDIPAIVDQQVSSEKWEGSRDAFLFLQECMRAPALRLDAIAKYKRNTAKDPVTPPLLSLSPPTSPFMPSQRVGFIEMESSASNSTAAEAQAIETSIMADDAILLPPIIENMKDETLAPTFHSDSQDSMLLEGPLASHCSPFALVTSTTVSSFYKRKSDIKVEVPLTPTYHPSKSETSTGKRIKTLEFPKTLHEYTAELPSLYENGDDCLGSQNSFEAFFRETVEPIAEAVNRNVEQEQLQEVDTTRRVTVPAVDMKLPIPPWDPQDVACVGRNQACQSLLHKTKKYDLTFMRHWPGVSKVERTMPWSPFDPKLGAMAVDETIQDDKALAAMMHEAAPEVVTSSQLIWKPDGLRILDKNDESEDELEPGVFEDENELSALLRKRKIEIDQDTSALTGGIERRSKMMRPGEGENVRTEATFDVLRSIINEHSADSPSQREAQCSRTGKLQPEDTTASTVTFASEGFFSTTKALHQFMLIQGNKMPIPQHPCTRSAHKQEPAQTSKQNKNEALRIQLQSQLPPAPIHTPISVPTWSLPSPLPKTSMIFSTNLLTHFRPLVRTLQSIHPDLAFIERDFESAISPVTEADIILSPATAIFLTSIQKIKQRSLPGQASRPGVKNQITAMTERYERVLVFVGTITSTTNVQRPPGFPAAYTAGLQNGLLTRASAGHTSVDTTTTISTNTDTLSYDDVPLDTSDAIAFAQLSIYCSLLPGDVIVVYIPGGLTHMAHATLHAQARYGQPAVETPTPTGTAAAAEAVAIVQQPNLQTPSVSPIVLLPDETLWELFLRRAGLNAYAAQSILCALRSRPHNTLATPLTAPADVISVDTCVHEDTSPTATTVTGLPAFLLMSQAEREAQFGAMLGGTRILRRVGRVVDGGWPSARNGFCGVGKEEGEGEGNMQ
ncbi:hypothetical protein EJ05DRAFT_541178 [Pseudovirgaria hyperparasitica]|uniref:Uncharacterized protein n=1 Tax=Pseudovirgaria hyperparasitica TaxID=470096 RepID=A0A6A6VVA7_9PEZI|nr:uncharacterized protein EJ05DRAFT_541178 [Pseudovirgaria hyperparasitica]KAF2754618.1 hypothetical protein EJ05DRAFT_541178 [Pseudovirgaria hyperparasitica]